MNSSGTPDSQFNLDIDGSGSPVPSSEVGAAAVEKGPRQTTGLWLFVCAVLAVLFGIIWADDAISLQGQRSVYTAECQDGGWQVMHCVGRLAAGARYTFQVAKGRNEVLFWRLDAPRAIGHLTNCVIADGRNWTCKSEPDAERAITMQMQNGSPMPSQNGNPSAFHAVPKWRWWLLRFGMAWGHDVKP